MRSDWQTQRLRRLLMDYYAVTGQRIGIFDEDFRVVLEYPEPHGAFCSWIRSSELGRRRCRDCDIRGMRETEKTGETVVYRCHAGLIEVCSPISAEGGPMGYIMFGQLLYDVDLPGQWTETRRRCAAIFPDSAVLEKAFNRVRRMSPGYVEATAHIMAACVGYIRLEHLMRRGTDGLWDGIQGYIARHIGAPFTLAEMAQELSVSVATLCKTAKDNSGKTIGRLMLEARLETARQLLRDTDLPVAEVADRVGIADYNYFSRLFHRENGMPPRAYRQAARENGRGRK